MIGPAFTVIAAGAATLQDFGRQGWKRFGLPVGGAMDRDSMRWANILVGNPPGAPVIETLLGQLTLRAEQALTIAVTGASIRTDIPLWRTVDLQPGQECKLGFAIAGLWTYLAVSGGFAAPAFFGSVSVNARAGLGSKLASGDRLFTHPAASAGIAGRFRPPFDLPDFGVSPTIPIWRGPEWFDFSESFRHRFLETEWAISSRSDRVGYRLDGPLLDGLKDQIPSAPVREGTIQVPAEGAPIVLMRDGPTVGGYPRLALIDPPSLSAFSQCAPGRTVRFRLTGDGHQ